MKKNKILYTIICFLILIIIFLSYVIYNADKKYTSAIGWYDFNILSNYSGEFNAVEKNINNEEWNLQVASENMDSLYDFARLLHASPNLRLIIFEFEDLLDEFKDNPTEKNFENLRKINNKIKSLRKELSSGTDYFYQKKNRREFISIN